jgi:hypothetical protein
MTDNKPVSDPNLQEETQKVVSEVKDEKLSEFLGEKVEAGKVEPPAEPPAKEETPASKESAKEEGVDFDPEKFKEETAKKTAEEVGNRIAEALKGKAPEKDEYAEFEKSVWEKEGRTPTYKEALDFVATNVSNRIRSEQEEAAKKAKDEEEKRTEAQQGRVAAFNRYIDDQLEDLVSQGKLHGIINKEDNRDLGVQERKALFKIMQEVNQRRTTEGKEPIYSIKEIFYEHYKPVNQQPPGANAPVSMGGQSYSGKEEKEIDYNRDIRNKSFVDIVMGAFK